MKYSVILLLTFLTESSLGQFENGFVKILQDKRYQEGSLFGNFREQEDGITYFEENDANGFRRGFWKYPSEDGRIQRVEFEAGPRIGFRITDSSFVGPTLTDNKTSVPQSLASNLRVPKPATTTTTPQPVALNLFDYPARVELIRHNLGHRLSFSAL